MNGIVLVGDPGSGKSTIAAALCDRLGWERRSFAAPLKDEVAYALTNADVRGADFDRFKEVGQKYRSEMDDPAVKDRYRLILQWWGTEFRREQDPEYWVHQLVRTLAQGGGYVIDDCRFNNEWTTLKLLGFDLVYLMPGATTREVSEHASEVDWKRWAPNLELEWEQGPEHQADRIVEALKLRPVGAK